jgi:hypothetical protein
MLPDYRTPFGCTELIPKHPLVVTSQAVKLDDTLQLSIVLSTSEMFRLRNMAERT